MADQVREALWEQAAKWHDEETLSDDSCESRQLEILAYIAGHEAATASHAADVEALTKAAQRLCRSFPTDDDMAAAGWGRAEIDEACNAYDALRAALKGDKP